MADCDSTSDPHSPRKRPWLRRVGLVVGCLLAGAVINVLVAWGFALFIVPRPSIGDVDHALGTWHSGGRVSAAQYFVVTRLGTTRCIGIHAYDYYAVTSEPEFQLDASVIAAMPKWGRGVILGESFATRGVPYSIIAIAEARGWPLLTMRSSLRADYQSNGSLNRSDLADAFLLTDVTSHERLFEGDDPRSLPYKIMWSGFLMNTVFYGVIAWMLFAAPRVVRRHRRAKKRLCPDCGYDVRGAAHGKCPECGEAVAVK